MKYVNLTNIYLLKNSLDFVKLILIPMKITDKNKHI